MPQFDPANFPTQLVWLAIAFILLYVILSRVALPRISSVLEERQRRIRADLEKAERLKAEAEGVLAEYEALMAETRSQAQDVLRQAKEEMAAQSARQQQELADKITRSASDAETRIDKARQDALANIREIAIDVARDATKRLIDTEVEPAEAEAAVDSARGGRG